MTDDPRRTAAHPPAASRVFRAQLALLAARSRRGALIAAVYILAQGISLASAGVIFGLRVTTHRGEETTVTFGTHIGAIEELGATRVDEGVAALLFTAAATAVWGLFWPFQVWRREVPSRRDYHRSMPVGHRPHDLLRLAAGASALGALTVLVVAVVGAVAGWSGHGARLAELPASAWLNAVLAPLFLYLLTSALVMATEHPAGWLWGGLGGLFILSSLLVAAGATPLLELLGGLAFGRFGIAAAVAGPLWLATLGDGAGGPAWILVWGWWTTLAAGAAVAAAGRVSRRL